MKCHIRREEFLAALLFASEDDSRYILTGVNIEFRKTSPPLLATTDGRRLCAIESTAPQEETAVGGNVILSGDVLRRVCAFFRNDCKLFPIGIETHGSKRVVFSVPMKAIDVEDGGLIDGDFPNWRIILPCGEKEVVPEIGLNAEFVGDYAAASKLLAPKKVPTIRVNLFGQTKAMDIRLHDIPQFYGVLMPARIIEDDKFQPSFTFAKEQPTTQSKAA